jgi:DNA modification methylase
VTLPAAHATLHAGDALIRFYEDPFVGLGHTAVACAQLGLPFIGIDINGVYLREATARVRQAIATTRRRR